MGRPTSFIISTLLAATGLQLALGGVAAASDGRSGQGVTSHSIKLGITYPDLAALRAIINVNAGNYQVAYSALIDQINAHGGIDGRKIVPVFAAVYPAGTAGAATACTRLTEDDNVFATIGFFQAADTACYLSAHDTPIIGASLTAAQAAQAKAPWYNNMISDSDQIPKEMTYFKNQGVFKGKKVGVVTESANLGDEFKLVLPELKKLKVDVVQTAINSAPDSDTVSLYAQYGVIAQKFKSTGVNEVVAVGNAGNNWPRSEQNNQSTYLPRIVAVDYTDLAAYVTDAAGHLSSVLDNAITAGGIPPQKVIWENPAMKRCVATIQAKEPNAPINDPVTATSSTPVTWIAPELACSQMAMFEDFASAAGKVLNNETFAKGAESLTHASLPGGGTFNFSAGHNDGDGPVYVFTWSPSVNNLVLKTQIG